MRRAGYCLIRFNCDYGEGAHPRILERLQETNYVQTPGYGEDEYCREAADIIRNLCKRDDLDVHFLMGGTQANLTVLSAALRPWQGVVSTDAGHIAVHETGSIEACGHKVLCIPTKTASCARRRWRNCAGRTMPTLPLNTWCSRGRCTSPAPRSWAPSTPARS